MKVWITRHALEERIWLIDAEPLDQQRVVARSLVSLASPTIYGPGEWFPAPEAAIARARTMRDLEVTKLRREIARLEAMAFEVGA